MLSIQAPAGTTDFRATGSHPHVLRSLRPPRRPHLRADREVQTICAGAVSPTTFIAGYLGLESRSGWCRRRELWLTPMYPCGRIRWVDRAPMARSKPALACSAESRAHHNPPLTLPVTPPSSTDESADSNDARSHEPFRPRAARAEFPRLPKTPIRDSTPLLPLPGAEAPSAAGVSPHWPRPVSCLRKVPCCHFPLARAATTGLRGLLFDE